MSAQRQDDFRIAEKAAEWAGTLDSAGTQEQAEFVAWLRQSARHVEEFLLASAMYRELDGIDSAQRENIERLMAEGASNVVPLNGGTHSTPTLSLPGARKEEKKRWRGAVALAAGIAGIAVAGWLTFGSFGWQSYRTDIGEQRAVELADGSLVQLNTRSTVQVRFSDEARDIQLVDGEALFKVAHDPRHPFRVRADDAVIEAIGTQFNVYLRLQETELSVLEGRVRVTQNGVEKILGAGETASIARDGRVTPVTGDTNMAIAWRQRRLMFRDDQLADVAVEFNRYNRTPQIRVEGAASERLLTGVFDADAPESLVRFLAGAEDLSVERDGEAVIIRHK